MPELFLSEEKNSNIDALLNWHTDFNSVIEEQQFDYTTFVDYWVLFAGVLEKCISMKDRLGDSTPIELDPQFGKAIPKIQREEDSTRSKELHKIFGRNAMLMSQQRRCVRRCHLQSFWSGS